jgi:hypothetical protein
VGDVKSHLIDSLCIIQVSHPLENSDGQLVGALGYIAYVCAMMMCTYLICAGMRRLESTRFKSVQTFGLAGQGFGEPNSYLHEKERSNQCLQINLAFREICHRIWRVVEQTHRYVGVSSVQLNNTM